MVSRKIVPGKMVPEKMVYGKKFPRRKVQWKKSAHGKLVPGKKVLENAFSINPFVGTGKSTKSDQKGKKIFFSENSHLGVFGYAESESVVKIKKFKMASSIWRTKM